MRYCGIDIASLSSFVYITDERGEKKFSNYVGTTKAELSAALKLHLKGGLKIAIEAGNQTNWIYHHLLSLGAEVEVVNPTRMKVIAESRRKTDKIDAKLLCELLRLKGLPHPVHMPSAESRELRALLVARRQLLQSRTRLCNTVRGLLRQEGVQLPLRGMKTFKVWNALAEASYKSGHLPVIIKTHRNSFIELTRSVQALDRELKARAAKDFRVALLRSMPMVGLIAALTLISAVDDVERFGSSRKLIGYSGLAPTVRQSGERAEYGHISREGRSELRGVWVQIAHLVARSTDSPSKPLRQWYLRVAKRRGQKTALVALARRLLTVAYQILKHGEAYDPQRLVKRAA